MSDSLASQSISQHWQTSFSATELSSPFTEQRPLNQLRKTSENRLYMTNYNLNIDISISSLSILTQTYGMLNQTNSANADASESLQRGVENWTETWNRPPNFLPVDCSNIGDFNRSVFQAAARANNVGYRSGGLLGNNGRIW
jgi:hypothetical protein